MTRNAVVFRTLPTRSLACVLPLAALTVACGGDKPSVKTDDPTAMVVPAVAVDSPSTPKLTPVSATVSEPVVNVKDGTRVFDAPMDAYKAGEYKTAVEMYKGKIETKSDDAFSHYMLGLSSWKAGDFKGAKDAFDKSITLDPTFAKAYFNGGRVLLDLKRAPEALEMIEKGRAIDTASLDGWRLVARAKSESGDTDGAMMTYRELLKQHDSDVWGLNNYGMLLFDRGDVQESLEPLARAVQVKPTAPLFLNNLGMALEQSGFPVAALHHYEMAVKHDSSYVKAVRNADRLKAAGVDGTKSDEVDVSVMAEQFRQKLRAW